MHSLTLAIVMASWLPTFPSFDGNAALVVGIIVAAGALLVIAMAIISPIFAIQGGTTTLGTLATIIGISLVTGTIAAGAAGFYWGKQGDIKRAEVVERVSKVSNQLDLFFEPNTGDASVARDYTINVVVYDEQGLDSKNPTVVARTQQIKVLNSDEDKFYAEIDAAINGWLKQRKSADEKGKARHVAVFMKPFPGDNVYSNIRERAEKKGCQVARLDGKWESALDR